MSKNRTLRESTEFTEALSRLGQFHQVDHALESLYWALSTRPEEYPILPGFRSLRLAKTRKVRKMPALRIFFTIRDEDDVDLLLVESELEEESNED